MMKKFLAILIIILLITGIAVGVYLVKIQQIFKSKANLEGTRVEIVDNSGNIITAAFSRNVKIKLIHSGTQPAVSSTPSATPGPTSTPRPSATPRPARVNMNIRGGIRFFNEDCITPYNGSATLRVLTVAREGENGKWQNRNSHNDLFYPISNHNSNQNATICDQTHHEYKDPGYQINPDGTFAGCPTENMDSCCIGGKLQCDAGEGGSGCWDSNKNLLACGDTTGFTSCAYSCQSSWDDTWGWVCKTNDSNDVCMEDMDKVLDQQEVRPYPQCFPAFASHYEITSSQNILKFDSRRDLRRAIAVGAPSGEQLKVLRVCTSAGCNWNEVSSSPTVQTRASDFVMKDFNSNWNYVWGVRLARHGLTNYFISNMENADGNTSSWVYDICVKAASVISVPTPPPAPTAPPSSSPAVNVFPTHFRIANFQSGLEFAQEQSFDQNGKQVDWRLSQGNGQKTVYVQYKVNGVWENPLISQVTLNYTDPIAPKFGMQIDVRDQAKIPTQSQADLIRPGWVRFVYPCTDKPASPNCPDDWHKVNLISSIPNPDAIKRLAIVNGETAWGSPVGSTDVALWTAYINNNFLPVVKQVASEASSRLSAIELWNEEDHPYVPPLAFAYLLKSSSALIRSINPSLDIVVGGVLSGAEYLKAVKTAEMNAFSDIDAIGVHPYVIPDQINNITTIINTLRQSNSEAGINLPIWITEMGIQEFTSSTVPKNQKEFMEKAFDQIVVLSPIPQVINWYAFIDTMTGSDGTLTWGLFKTDGSIKPSGEFFKAVSNPVLPSPSATASASPVATVAPTSVPSSSPTGSQGRNADFNRDGKVNSVDVALLFSKWNSRISADLVIYDLNSDGIINGFDFMIVKSRFSN